MPGDNLRVTWLVNGRAKTGIHWDPLDIRPDTHINTAISRGKQFTLLSSGTK